MASRVAGVKHVRNHLVVALPPGDHRDDSTLTAMANNALTLGHTVAAGVQATAKSGDITLTGAVRCGAERAAAEAMIADLTGVRSVTNGIQIRDDADPLLVSPDATRASAAFPPEVPERAGDTTARSESDRRNQTNRTKPAHFCGLRPALARRPPHRGRS